MADLYAFDVDDTLAVTGGPPLPGGRPRPAGPIQLDALLKLREQGHIVGVAGNWPVFIEHVPDWQRYVSFIGPLGGPGDWTQQKVAFLKRLAYFAKADHYFMVGNDPYDRKWRWGVSDDITAAHQAGYTFIAESHFTQESQS